MMMAEKIADHTRGRTPLAPSTATYYQPTRRAWELVIDRWPM